MNNRNLIIIFAGLLAIYAASKLFNKKTTRSFDPNIVQVDTSLVNSISISAKADNFEEVVLKKEADGWTITKGDFTAQATGASVKSLLGQITSIQAKRIAAKKKDKWADYEVEEGKANRVKVFQGSKLVEDLIVGRFDFNQQARSMTSFVRPADEDNVYAVDGFLSMSFGQGFNGFRDNTVLRLDKGAIQGFSIQKPGEQISVQRMGGQWIGDQIQVDSAKVEAFLSGISSVSGTEFVNNPENLTDPVTVFSVIDTLGNSTTVNCFQSNGEKPFVLNSTQNPDAYFASDSTGIYKRIFEEIF